MRAWERRSDADNRYAFKAWLRHEYASATDHGDPEIYVRSLAWRFLLRKAGAMGHAAVVDDIDRGLELSARSRHARDESLFALRLTVLHEALIDRIEAEAARGTLAARAVAGQLERAAIDAGRITDARERVIQLLLLVEIACRQDPGDRTGFARDLLSRAVAVKQNEVVLFFYDEEEQMLEFWRQLPSELADAGAHALETVMRPSMADELILVIAVSRGSMAHDIAPRVREAAHRVDLALAEHQRELHAWDDIGVSPFVRVGMRRPELHPALAELGEGTGDVEGALATIREAWAEYMGDETRFVDRGPSSYRALRRKLAAPPDRTATVAPDTATPGPSIADTIRFEVARALAAIDPYTSERVASAIDAADLRALAIAAIAPHHAATVHLAFEAGELLRAPETSLAHLGSLYSRDELRAALDGIARSYGHELSRAVLSRHFPERHDEKAIALRAYLALSEPLAPEVRSRRMRADLDEAISLVEGYFLEPDRGWQLMTAIARAVGRDAIAGFERLVEVTLARSSPSNGRRFSHEPFAACVRMLLDEEVEPVLSTELLTRIDHAMAAEVRTPAGQDGAMWLAWVRAALVQRRRVVVDDVSDWIEMMLKTLEQGFGNRFAGWGSAVVRDVVQAVLATQRDRGQRWLRELAGRLPWRPARVLGLWIPYLCWMYVLQDLMDISDGIPEALLLDGLQRYAVEGVPETALPRAEVFDLMSPERAAAVLTRLVPAVRRGAPVVERYGKNDRRVLWFAQRLVRADLASTPAHERRARALAIAATADLDRH